MSETRLPDTRFFASRSVAIHLARGLLGFALLGLGIYYVDEYGWWTAVPLLGALALFKGCPSCWLMGLYETVVQGKDPSCSDGSCLK